MSLFHKDEDKSKFGDLEAGALTLFAKLRLREHAKNPGMHFTSELSVPELLVTRAAGFEPIAQVTGCSVYHVGWQFQNFYGGQLGSTMFTSGYSGELDTITLAFCDAWDHALSRLQQEARMIGAHGVIGLHVHKSVLPDSFAEDATKASAKRNNRMIQLSLAGTAVRYPGMAPVEHPTITTLTGQEFYALRQTGCFPVGFAVGVSVYNLSTFLYGSGYGLTFVNCEMTEHVRAFEHARSHAMTRVEAAAQTLGGTGLVDVKADYDASSHEIDVNEQKGMAITVMFLCFGTVIADAGWTSNEGPSYCVSLLDLPEGDRISIGK